MSSSGTDGIRCVDDIGVVSMEDEGVDIIVFVVDTDDVVV